MSEVDPSPRSAESVVLFDLDGVLWDTSDVHDRAFREVGADLGLSPLDYSSLAGRSTREAWLEILAANDWDAESPVLDDLIRAKQERAREHLTQAPPLTSELRAVRTLIAAGRSVGLVTGSSSKTVQVFLEASDLDFAAVVTADSVPHGKPDPAPYLVAMDQLGADPTHTWVLEDSEQGLASAIAAGCRAVHLRPTATLCSSGHPAHVSCVGSIREFVDLLGKD